MEYRIAFYSRKKSERKLIEEGFPECKIDYYFVKNLPGLKEAFLSTEKEYDGFLASGLFSDRVISLLSSSIRRDASGEYFNATVESYYRYLLEKTVSEPDLSLSQIRLDLMEEQDDLKEIVFHNRLEQMMQDEIRLVNRFSVEQTMAYEQEMVARHQRCLQEGKIRFFVTRSSMSIRMFQECGAPFHFLEVTRNEVMYKLNLLKKAMEIKTIEKGLTALIYFDMGHVRGGARGEEEQLRFQQAVYRYSQATGYNLILKPSQMDFEIFTDAQTVQQMTGSFCRSPLYDYLRKEIRFQGGMGYGIGISLQQARENAYEAAVLSARRASEGVFQSYLINQQNSILTLASSAGAPAPENPGAAGAISSDYVEQVATRCRLSSENVLRVLEFSRNSGNQDLTSELLTSRLGVSLRTANKILSHLQEGDAAEVVGQKRLGQKGRPVNIYRLKLEPM